MENVSVWAALWAGIASFVSPCVLPLVPTYLASLAGPDIFEPEKLKRLPLFLHALAFVLGFTLVFILMETVVRLVGLPINPFSPVTRYISGGLLIFFGAFMLAAFFIPALNFEKRLSPRVGQTTSYARSFLIGATFTLAWTPCVGPLLGSVLTMAGTSATAWQGAGLVVVYSLGMGIPFLLLGLFFGTLGPLLRKLGPYTRWIYAVSGVLLVAVGILVVLGKLSLLSAGF